MKKVYRIFLFSILITKCMPCIPANYLWNGSVDNQWSNALNWTPLGVPGGSDNVAITGVTPYSPQITGNVSVSSITISSLATLDVLTYTLTVTGTASLNNCSINGTNPGSICLLGSSNVVSGLSCAADCYINSGSWNVSGSIFGGSVVFLKNGGIGIPASGGNLFNGPVIVTNNSSGILRFGMTNPDIFNFTSSFENKFSGTINLAYNSTGNLFNGDITIMSSTLTVGNINFGISGGTSTLGVNATIKEDPTGFLGGTLEIRNLAQLGNTIIHSLDLSLPVCCSSTALTFKIGPGCTFDGPVNFSASNILLNGAVYNGMLTQLTKTFNGSAASNISNGGNVYNSPNTYIGNQTTSTMRLANINPDDYNGNVRFWRGSASGYIDIAYNGVNTFAGDIEISASVTGTQVMQFGYGTGTIVLDGSGNQSIKRLTPTKIPPPSITRLNVNKSSGSVYLYTDVDVLNSQLLNSGIIYSSVGNYMILNNGAITNLGNAGSFIEGPMIYKLGSSLTTTLNFPLGKSGIHRPAFLSTAHTDASLTSYTAEVIGSSAAILNYSLAPTISNVSNVRYWQIDRESLPNFSNANITLFYGPDDGVTNPSALSVAKTIGTATAWNDYGGTGSSMTTGSITSNQFSSFSKFTLANKVGGGNPLPVEVVDFFGVPEGAMIHLMWKTSSEKNSDYFMLEKSNDAINFKEIERLTGAGTSYTINSYSGYDEEPNEGVSYYRLRQIDKDGSQNISKTISVNFLSGKMIAALFPNPTEKELNIQIKNGNKEFIKLSLINGIGQIVYKENFTAGSSNFIKKVDMESFPSGCYYLRLETLSEVKNYLVLKS